MRIFTRILLLISFILAGVLLANAQQAPQTAPAQNPPAKTAAQKPAPRKPFVWTDDNIDNVRSAADDYQVQQAKEKAAQQAAAQQAAAQKAAAAAAAKNDRKNLYPAPKVSSVQQADEDIAQRGKAISSEQGYLQEVQKRLANTNPTGIERERLEWRLKSHAATVRHLQNQIKDLEAQKSALEKQPQSGSKSNSSSAPQSQ